MTLLFKFRRCSSAKSTISIGDAASGNYLCDSVSHLNPKFSTETSLHTLDTKQIQFRMNQQNHQKEDLRKISRESSANGTDPIIQMQTASIPCAKNRPKPFKSDTRSSILSSSVESTKEEKIVAYLDHSPTNKVIVLPRPQQQMLSDSSQEVSTIVTVIHRQRVGPFGQVLSGIASETPES